MSNKNLGPYIIDLTGLTLTPIEENLLIHPLVGGIIIFSRNYDNPQQLQDLIQHVRTIRPELLLCVDQEGGRVQRLQNQFTRLPHMRLLGDLWDSARLSEEETLKIAEELGYLMAIEVRSIGLDLSFAPVLDIHKGISDIMRDRAIHRHPEIISLLAQAYIQGMHLAGMKATGKHFPGHGHVKADSHLELPEDNRSLDLLSVDINPFKALVLHLDAIMTAHILYPAVDTVPATFSSTWLQQILRKELQFQGAIISDDLGMKGAHVMGSFAERAQSALDAGCDFILACNDRIGALEILEKTNDVADQQTFERRSGLRATLNVPAWGLLKEEPAWQKAYQSLKALTIELNTEKT